MTNNITAVEWLIEQLEKYHHPTEAMVLYAKQMEKEQIMKAYEDNHALSHLYGNNGEIYYKETYG